MAPEYFTTGNITKASDIWSLGVMLLEALTGTHPFGKTTQGLSNEQIIRNILSKDITAEMQNVTAPFKDLITRCLLREAHLRPQSAEELKGLIQSSGDAFTERTQIISTKNKVLETENSKPKWKQFIAAFFDFDVSSGKWRKILAREVIVNLALVIVCIISFYTYILFQKEKLIQTENRIKSECAFIKAKYPNDSYYPIFHFSESICEELETEIPVPLEYILSKDDLEEERIFNELSSKIYKYCSDKRALNELEKSIFGASNISYLLASFFLFRFLIFLFLWAIKILRTH
jgi:serine/threonine protein kinase